MKNKIFNNDYNKYWKNRVDKAIDGTKVPGNNVIADLVFELNIQKQDRVLDLGCGYGRIFPELSNYSDKVHGIDIDISMVNDSSKYGYLSLHCASTEQTKFPKDYFDKVISLGVFDVVEQEDSLFELNRILKPNGICMFSGKNINYFDDDEAAFIAEKNAKLKDFPNHFTDIYKLIANLDAFGFSCKKLFIYLRRGDFGENKKVSLIPEITSQFYEYSIYLKKEKSIQVKPSVEFTSEFSNTAKRRSNECKTVNVIDFFKNY